MHPVFLLDTFIYKPKSQSKTLFRLQELKASDIFVCSFVAWAGGYVSVSCLSNLHVKDTSTSTSINIPQYTFIVYYKWYLKGAMEHSMHTTIVYS